MRVSVWTRALLALALVKLAGTLAALVAASDLLGGYQGRVSPFVDAALILSFGGVAGFLLVNRGEDRRAVALGGLFLMIGSAFCARSLIHLSKEAHGGLQDWAQFLGFFELDCFVPLFFWAFVRDFPAVPVSARVRHLIHLGLQASAVAGAGLFLSNLLLSLLGILPLAPPHWLQRLKPMAGEGPYYLAIAVLVLLALPVLVRKALAARGEEGRRVRLFTLALVAGLSPALVEMFLELTPFGYKQWMQERPASFRQLLHVYCFILLTIPFTTAYAVVVHHVLDLKLIARRVLRWALARYTAMALVAVPFAGICLYIYRHSDRRIEELFSGAGLLAMLAAMGLGVAALRYRRPILEAIDRRFFREQFDARQILTQLIASIRVTSDTIELANLIASGADRALHVESVALLVEDPRSGMLADPHPRSRARRLDASSPLAQMIANGSEPLDVDLGHPRSPLAKLPDADRHWLVDSEFRLLVPILTSDGELLGLIGLGEKKSGLPFLREDRRLLADIARTAALGLELRRANIPGLRPPAEGKPPTVENAKECLHCGHVFLPYMVFCGKCSRRLDPALVPYVLPGRLRFEKRIGAGGMGIVYRGSDLSLGRAVAVKTLRRTSPEDAIRLRREARLAAAVLHPHLAAIFGLETWRGTPMLVLEFLEGGTLSERLERGPMEPREVIELGIVMAEALERLHAADILHRDIKPSNIGYTRDGTPKLMDFGIARTRFDSRSEGVSGSGTGEEGDSSLLPPTSIWDQSPNGYTPSKQLVGTLIYLAPEVLNGEFPEAASDLWSLCVVLYECVLGRKVFAGEDMKQVMTRIRLVRVPDPAKESPGADPALAEFFRTALHKSPSRRPTTARELKRRLQDVRLRLAAGGPAAPAPTLPLDPEPSPTS